MEIFYTEFLKLLSPSQYPHFLSNLKLFNSINISQYLGIVNTFFIVFAPILINLSVNLVIQFKIFDTHYIEEKLN